MCVNSHHVKLEKLHCQAFTEPFHGKLRGGVDVIKYYTWGGDTHAHAHTHTHTQTQTHTHTHNTRTHTHTHTHTQAHKHTHTHTANANAPSSVKQCVCVCVCNKQVMEAGGSMAASLAGPAGENASEHP